MRLTPLQRAVLTGDTTRDVGGICDRELEDVLGWADEHRLIGQLAALPGAERVEPITTAYRRSLELSLAAEATAVRAHRILISAGITPVVLKGIAAAHADYPDPAMRVFRDADLLVARSELAAGADALQSAGWQRVPSPLGREFEAKFGRAVVLIDPDGTELDLHAMIAGGYFGVRLDHQALLASREPFELGGTTLYRLAGPDRVLATAYALVLSRGGNLRLLVDYDRQLQRHRRRGHGARAVLAEADRQHAELIGHVSPSAAVRRHPALVLTRSAQRAGWRADAIGEMVAHRGADRRTYTQIIARHVVAPRRPRE